MSTSNTTVFQCPTPFLLQDNYPNFGGNFDGRLCASLGEITCCLPCPREKWFYPDHFETLITAATYFNLASVAACIFLLASFSVLPTTDTHRHYLSVCLVVAVLVMELAFVIPFGSEKHQCLNDITPNDMSTSAVCALSGSFLLLGGWCVVIWVFLRALSLHLQICWQLIPGRRFFIASQVAGWAVPAGMLALALSITGVSFRFGNTCHINSKNGLASFWGPLLALAAASIVTQFVTFGYCIQVFVRSLFEDKIATNTSIQQSSIFSATYAQALRRVRRVVSLQWRGILVVIVIIADVVFFATVFLQFDGTTEKTPQNIALGTQWATCMVLAGGDKMKCLYLARQLVIPEATAVTVLFLLSCNGVWVVLLLGRASMVTGWGTLIKDLFAKRKPKDEFVSFNALRTSPLAFSPRTYGNLADSHYEDNSPSDGKFRDDSTIESYELRTSSATNSIMRRESFRPAPTRASSAYSGSMYNPTPSPISVPLHEEDDAELGYGMAISTRDSRPIYTRSATSPTYLQTTHSVKKSLGRNITPELEALEMSMASSAPRSQSHRAFPSDPRIPPQARKF